MGNLRETPLFVVIFASSILFSKLAFYKSKVFKKIQTVSEAVERGLVVVL